MTDSESEISNPNVFTFQNANTTVSAKGPNTNISNFSFRNPLTSTMYVPQTFERPRYAESVLDQRSIYYRRERSPMSIHSACDIRPRNRQQFYSGMGSSQSVFKGRGGSPMSMRSINSNASVSAADIVFAFKNEKFNKHDLKAIQEAYHKLMKQRNRKRIEKRRNMRLFLKGSRNRSGGDSGEQGSDSSISSDDCRSVKTSYKENISSSRLARIDPVDFRNTVRDSNMVKDCTKSLKQNTFRNMFSIGTSNYNRSQMLNSTSYSNQSQPSLKERFKTGFVLPSQRFNSSVASTVIPENTVRQPKTIQNNYKPSGRSMENRSVTSESEEDIFPDVTVLAKTTNHSGTLNKRTLESEDDASLPERKKVKNSSPNKISITKTQQPRAKNNSPINNNVKKHSNNNFVFTKPTLPIRKSRPMVKEKVIAKSKQPPAETYSPKTNLNNVEAVQPIVSPEKSDITQTQTDQCEVTQSSDVSMRPSFIKRKLFTQKLDVVEKANLSSDASNSPQNVYSALQKEKNKIRKLVTSQSCMNREVQEDNNLLELIHKIVPPDSINKTNQTSINVTKMDVNHSNKKDDDDAWDVTSVISMCNEHNMSDTFTDEEIFESDNKKINKTKKTNGVNYSLNSTINTKPKAMKSVAENSFGAKECRIVIDKIPKNVASLKLLTDNDVGESIVKSSAKTFWDTDFESDAECHITAQNRHLKESQTTVNTATEISKPEFKQPFTVSRSPTSKNEKQIPETSKWLNSTKNTTDINNTIDNTRRFNISSLTVRSHRTSKKKKCCNETGYQEMFFKRATNAKNEAKNYSEPVSNGKDTNEPSTNCKTKSNKAESKSKTTSKLEESKCKSKPSESKLTNSDKHNKISSKPESNASNRKSSKNVSNQKHPTSNEPMTSISVNTDITKNKKDNKSMSNSQNSNKSTSRTRKSPREKKSPSRTRKSPRETKSKADKENNRKINVLNQTTDRPIRTCRSRTPSLNRLRETSRSSRQFNISPLTTILHRTPKKKDVTSLQAITPLSENIIKPKARKANKKSVINGKTRTDFEKISKSNIQNVNLPISSAPIRKSPRIKKPKQIKEMPSYQTPKLDRPIRLCRTPSQNRSMENYKRR